MQFERLSGPTQKPETANSSQAGTCTALQNRSRSGVGQSSSYDQDGLAPRLGNKSGAFSIAGQVAKVLQNNDAEVNTDELHHRPITGMTMPDGIDGESTEEIS